MGWCQASRRRAFGGIDLGESVSVTTPEEMIVGVGLHGNVPVAFSSGCSSLSRWTKGCGVLLSERTIACLGETGAHVTAGDTAQLWDTRRWGSTPPDANDAGVGNLLVDEVGNADARRELILEQLHARHDLAARPRRSVRHPGQQFLG